jgi:hypothetical protein
MVLYVDMKSGTWVTYAPKVRNKYGKMICNHSGGAKERQNHLGQNH